jgi:hypothetical protein
MVAPSQLVIDKTPKVPEEYEMSTIAIKKSPSEVVTETLLPPLHPERKTNSLLGEDQANHSREASTYDGVFSNLSARPEVMVLPKLTPDSPPVALLFVSSLTI